MRVDLKVSFLATQFMLSVDVRRAHELLQAALRSYRVTERPCPSYSAALGMAVFYLDSLISDGLLISVIPPSPRQHLRDLTMGHMHPSEECIRRVTPMFRLRLRTYVVKHRSGVCRSLKLHQYS